MTDQPLVWHYGLVAETWAEFSLDTPELPFLQSQIARFGQPVLDLACGTGRLLVPMRQAGIDIDGCDISADMLALCRDRAHRSGLTVRLYQQAMHDMDLPRTYKTIYICGSFGLAGSRDLDQLTLKACYRHLDGGGALILNIDAEYTFPEYWLQWLKEEREKLPEPWPESGDSRTAADGTVYVTRSRMVALDPLEQSYLRQLRVEKWRADRLVAEEERTLRGNMYFKNEVALMLKHAGFTDVEIQGGYTDEPATADHAELLFIAQK